MERRHLHLFGWGALAVALLVGSIVWLTPSRRLAPEKSHWAVAERLPEAARAALKTQMHTHARGTLELTSAATLLDYETVGATVKRLLEEPRVAPPLSRDASELNAQLPPRFFALQDQLRDELQRVGRAASSRDAEALADSFGATMKTCIQCHDAFLTGR